MALGRSSQISIEFFSEAGWLVYFMMHRFKFMEHGCEYGLAYTSNKLTRNTHIAMVANVYRTSQMLDMMVGVGLLNTHKHTLSDIVAYFIEIENYRKSTCTYIFL